MAPIPEHDMPGRSSTFLTPDPSLYNWQNVRLPIVLCFPILLRCCITDIFVHFSWPAVPLLRSPRCRPCDETLKLPAVSLCYFPPTRHDTLYILSNRKTVEAANGVTVKMAVSHIYTAPASVRGRQNRGRLFRALSSRPAVWTITQNARRVRIK